MKQLIYSLCIFYVCSSFAQHNLTNTDDTIAPKSKKRTIVAAKLEAFPYEFIGEGDREKKQYIKNQNVNAYIMANYAFTKIGQYTVDADYQFHSLGYKEQSIQFELFIDHKENLMLDHQDDPILKQWLQNNPYDMINPETKLGLKFYQQFIKLINTEKLTQILSYEHPKCMLTVPVKLDQDEFVVWLICPQTFHIDDFRYMLSREISKKAAPKTEYSIYESNPINIENIKAAAQKQLDH